MKYQLWVWHVGLLGAILAPGLGGSLMLVHLHVQLRHRRFGFDLRLYPVDKVFDQPRFYASWVL